MTILVTGAAGFIGSNLTETLLRRGEQVVAVDNFNDYYDPARKRANILSFQSHHNLSLYENDIGDADAMERIFAQYQPRAVAHLGAYGGVRYSIGRAKLYTEVNLVATVNLLEAARQNGTEIFVFASTSSVYGNTTQLPFIETDPCNLPLAPYPASKKAAEVMGYTYFNLHRLNFTALRFFSVYGPRGRPDMMPFMVTDRIVKGQEIKLFDAGQLKRDWTYVDDIVSGIIAALERPLGYEVINLGCGSPIALRDFIEVIEEYSGRSIRTHSVPTPPSDPPITFCNNEKARRLLGFAPSIPVRDGLHHTWAWFRQHFGVG